MTAASVTTSGATRDTQDENTPAVRYRAIRLVLDPLPCQRAMLAQHAGTARWAYNHAIGAKTAAHKQWTAGVKKLVDSGIPEEVARKQVTVPVPSKAQIQKALNATKGDETRGIDGPAAWWRSVSTWVFQAAFVDADTAWKNWIESCQGKRAGRGVGFPRFKKKGSSRDSFRLNHDAKNPTIRPDGYRRLVMPRLGSIRLKDNCKRLVRAIRRGAVVKNVTVSRGGRNWYAAVVVEEPVIEVSPTRRQRDAGRIGVALGTRPIAALSNSIMVNNPEYLARAAPRIAALQHAVTRSQPGSHRRARRVAALGHVHHQLAERRIAYLHQITKRLATDWAEVAVPQLDVLGFVNVRQARRRRANTSRAVIAAANRALLDTAPGEFCRQIHYKTSWHGSRVVVCTDVSTASKTCSQCGIVKAKLGPDESVFSCGNCGVFLPRSVNTARVIAEVAEGDGGRDSDVAVASDVGETQNARRVALRPASPRGGGRAAMKREDPG
jgi:putative transposase